MRPRSHLIVIGSRGVDDRVKCGPGQMRSGRIFASTYLLSTSRTPSSRASSVLGKRWVLIRYRLDPRRSPSPAVLAVSRFELAGVCLPLHEDEGGVVAEVSLLVFK
jgi:hypothetical protein